LAFISEFNVQMLYLPGLKNVVADFSSRPSPPPPQPIQSTSKLWLPSKFTAQERSACLAIHPSNWLSVQQAPNASLAMFPQAFFAPMFPKNSEKILFSIFTTFHIPGSLPPGVWYLLGLSGEDWPATSWPGRRPASTASKPRSIATRACRPSQSPSCSDIFLIFTLIWWDP
jgi:hypothetical protein